MFASPEPTKIFRTQLISFPRAGCSLLLPYLYQALGTNNIHFADHHKHPGRRLSNDPDTNLEKHHDFDLSLIPDPSLNYLVLYRDPLQAIASWFDLELATHNSQFPTLQDTQHSFNLFLRNSLAFWLLWMHKWIWHPSFPHLPLSFDSLLLNMPLALSLTINSISNHPNPSSAAYASLSALGPPSPRFSSTSHRFLSPQIASSSSAYIHSFLQNYTFPSSCDEYPSL